MADKVSDRRTKLIRLMALAQRLFELNEEAGKTEELLYLSGVDAQDTIDNLNRLLRSAGPPGWQNLSNKSLLNAMSADGVLDVAFVDDSLCDEIVNVLAGLGDNAIDWASDIEDRLSDGSVEIGPNGTPEGSFAGGFGSLILGRGPTAAPRPIPQPGPQPIPQPDPERPPIPTREEKVAAPDGLIATFTGTTGTLFWRESAGATSYQYRRKLTSESDWGDWMPAVVNPGENDSDLTLTSVSIPGLLIDTSYDFQVRAIDSNKESDVNKISDPSNTAVGRSVPITPTSTEKRVESPAGITASQGLTIIDFFWIGVAGATSYQYRSRIAGTSAWGDWAPAVSNPGTEDSSLTISYVRVTGLTKATDYEFQFRSIASDKAISTNRLSAESLTYPISTVDDEVAVKAPSSVLGFGFEEAAELVWATISDATSYQYRHKLSTSANYGPWLPAVTNPGTEDSTLTVATVRITGLQGGQNYDFEVRSISTDKRTPANRVSGSSPRTRVAVKQTATENRITAPELIYVQPGDKKIDLLWFRVSGATSYQHRRRLFGAGSWGSWLPAVANAGDDSTLVGNRVEIAGLVNGTAYEFQIRSIASDRTIDANKISLPSTIFSGIPQATPDDTAPSPSNQAPGVPTALSANSVPFALSFSWGRVDTATFYEWRIKPQGGVYGSPHLRLSPEVTIRETAYDLLGNTNYTLQVRAGNTHGNSAWSAEVSVIYKE